MRWFSKQGKYCVHDIRTFSMNATFLTPTLTPTDKKRLDTAQVYCSEWDWEIRRIRQNGNIMCAIDVQTHLCNQQVGGSSPSTSSNFPAAQQSEYGGIPEWPKGADCKSVVSDFGGSNPPSPTSKKPWNRTISRLFAYLPYPLLYPLRYLQSNCRIRKCRNLTRFAAPDKI